MGFIFQFSSSTSRSRSIHSGKLRCFILNTKDCLCLCFILLISGLLVSQTADAGRLDEYIQDYQTLTFDTHAVHKEHERVRRSVDGSLHINFKAYNRHFKLRLKRDVDIFDPDHQTVSDDGHLVDVDTSFIYSGHVHDVPNSFAHISIINGSARGYVDIPGDTTYHIESAAQYFQDPKFHAVIYPVFKINHDPFRHKREADDLGTCGMERVREWMNRVQRSAVEDITDRERKRRSPESRSDSEYERAESGQSKYWNDMNSHKSERSAGSRQKRATLGVNNTCFLYLRSDPMMWKFVKYEKFKDGKLTDERAKEEILTFFASHVSALKNIFHRTVFTTYNDDLRYSGVNFVVRRTSIMTQENQKCGTPNASSYCNPNIDVSNFLNLNSLDKHDEFCLAYIFTHRDFTRGTLGLAWVGAREVASGGICERHKSYLESDVTVPKSLNTGIVTTVNYGKAVPARVSQLTFTHEVGHNFGSPHDNGSECVPFGSGRSNAQDGNYIMFASATMGDRPNNDDFSVCSKDNITRLLHVVINELNMKRNCFKPSKTAFCGNGIKEKGEQCDCGYHLDCEDSCCYGRGSDDGEQCTLQPDVQCSPTAGACCTSSCKFVTKEDRLQCLQADDCRQSAYCQGLSAECPHPKPQPNGTFCNDDAQMCFKGECVNSVCGRIEGKKNEKNWEECFLTAGEGSNSPSREALCYVACTNPETGKCVSSSDAEAIRDPTNAPFRKLLINITRKRTGKQVLDPEGIQLPAGSPCDNFRGYCDVFHKCRGVDADGPLARLKNLIFNPETLENIQQWIVAHWWAVLLMSLGLVVVMGAFIKVCAVHTPSSNPRKPKHRQLTLPRTLQRRHNRQRQQAASGQQQQQQHRGAGPRSVGSSGPPTSSAGGAPSGSGIARRNKPNSSNSLLIEQDPPPPYSSTNPNQLTGLEIIAAPSSSSPASPMVEAVGAPDLMNIPPGGPKRGHGGPNRGQKKAPQVGLVVSASGKVEKGKKKGEKGSSRL